MRIAYFDCFAGVSGDMTVAALLSAGMPIEYLRAELEKLPLEGYELSMRLVERSMISAVKFDVEILVHGHAHSEEDAHLHEEHEHDHSHSHPGGHVHHHHEHNGGHHHHDEHETHVHHHGLSYVEIRQLIGESDLATGVKRRALAIFHTIGEAEARIHAVPLEEVHFHEVGAIDSVVDIVSTAVGLEYFEVEECRSRPVPLGNGGTIRTAHGIMPIPAPATLDILKGYPTELGRVAAEMTTPTGAGIIRSMSRGTLAHGEEIEPFAIGYGAGTMEFRELPNLLRIVIGEIKHEYSEASAFPVTDHVIQFTTAIDDMPPTTLAYVQQLLLDEGALEAYLRPVIMKKGRAGHELLVLASENASERILKILQRETTTLGVRCERIARRIAHRRALEFVHLEWGVVRAKEIHHGDSPRTEFEFEDVKRIARETGLSYREVSERLNNELLR